MGDWHGIRVARSEVKAGLRLYNYRRHHCRGRAAARTRGSLECWGWNRAPRSQSGIVYHGQLEQHRDGEDVLNVGRYAEPQHRLVVLILLMQANSSC
eukprot:1489175-Prymnesium_polylepis.1